MMVARPWFDGGSPLVSIFLALGFASLINLAVELVSGRRSDSSCCPACWHCCPACWHCCPICWHSSPVCWHCSPVCWHCCPVGFCIWKEIEERFLCLDTQTPFLYLFPNREIEGRFLYLETQTPFLYLSPEYAATAVQCAGTGVQVVSLNTTCQQVVFRKPLVNRWLLQ